MSDLDETIAPDAPYAEPLPRGWLPDATAPAGDRIWEARAARILAAAEPECMRARTSGPPWLTEMGGWLAPSALLAAGAAALLVAVGGWGPRAARAEAEALALSAVVADGDPVALWGTLGVPADPVLALLTLEDHRPWMAPGGPTDTATGELR